MKHILLACSFLALFSITSQAQGISFFEGSWEEALEKAAAQDKLIFVDAYAKWCGPCKRMAAQVFPQDEVGSFFNRNFISVKMDMEAAENQSFRSQYPVSAYPTLFFINAKGEVVQKAKGAKQADGLIASGKKALALAEPSEDYAAAYENGDRSPELVYKYVRSLIRSGESHLKVANDYLRTQSDLNTADNLNLILLSATDSDSRIFDMMVSRKDAIIATTSTEAYYSQLMAACQTTADKAIEFSSPELLEEALGNVKENNADKYDVFEAKTKLAYAYAHRDAKAYAKAAKAYAKVVIPGKGKELKEFAMKIAGEFRTDKNVLGEAEAILKEALRFEDSYDYHYSLALIQNQLGKSKDALASAQKAMEKAEENNMPRINNMIQTLIDKLESNM